MAEIPPLPPGFTLDSAPSDVPPLPPGFTLDQQGQEPAAEPPAPTRGYFSRLQQANERAAATYTPLGGLEALGSMLTGAVALPLGSLAGMGTEAARGLGLTNARGEDVAERVQRDFTLQPRSQGGKDVMSYLGALTQPITESGADVALTPLLAGAPQAVRVPPNVPRSGTARPVLPGASRPVAPAGQAAPAVQGSAAAGRSAGLARVSKAAPTVEELKAAKNAAYKRSEEAGVQVSEFAIKKLKGRIQRDLGERINSTLHPDTTAALKDIADTKGAVSLEKLDQLRQIASDARSSTKPADARLAGRVVDTIDDFLDELSAKDVTRGDAAGVAALKEARELNTRLKKGEQIEELFRRAEIKAGANFTQSGLENALRQEFKALALDQKKLRRFSPEERAAITRVAKGAPMENALRFIGKLAPTGTVSGMLGAIVSAAVPGGVGLPIAGLAGRAAATRMTMRNANEASAMVRRGPRNVLLEPEPVKPTNALLEN